MSSYNIDNNYYFLIDSQYNLQLTSQRLTVRLCIIMFIYQHANVRLDLKMKDESDQVSPERLPRGTASKEDPSAKRLLGENERDGGLIIIILIVGIIHLFILFLYRRILR